MSDENENAVQDEIIEEIDLGDVELPKKRRKAGYASKKALDARLENLRKGREKRKKNHEVRQYISEQKKKQRENKYDDSDSEEDEYEYDDDYNDYQSKPRRPIYDYSSEEDDERRPIRKEKRRPSKSELKLINKVQKMEKFLYELQGERRQQKKPIKKVNKTVVMPVYPPHVHQREEKSTEDKISDKNKRDIIAMF